MKHSRNLCSRNGGNAQGELFELHFTAAYPNPESLAGIALTDLLTGKHLRQSDWLQHGWRLAAAINELANLGWPIISARVHVPGRRRPIADYSLPVWALREVGRTWASREGMG